MDKTSEKFFDGLYKLHDKYDESPEFMICAEAADHIKTLSEALKECRAANLTPPDIADLRNELCLKCGRYHESHLGACNDCKWKK